eukprot:1140557-Pelagomonas_calceolata.AAC.7
MHAAFLAGVALFLPLGSPKQAEHGRGTHVMDGGLKDRAGEGHGQFPKDVHEQLSGPRGCARRAQ